MGSDSSNERPAGLPDTGPGSGESTHFGRYEVKKVIGRGAMGTVYMAEDPYIRRRVAIKVIQPDPGLDSGRLAERQARFEREFRSAGTLSHPNIVTVHDVGHQEDASYLVVEYVPGESLETVLRSSSVMPFKAVADLALQIASGLDYAHQRGIVHRDIKPANILVTQDGCPKLTDFGIAKEISSTLTRAGSLVGTPAYMSPEQVTGKEELTGASDQFSLAGILYEILTGGRPFGGESAAEVLYKVVHQRPPPPTEVNPDLPQEVDQVLLRALDRDPAKRFPSCMALAEALAEALGKAPPDSVLILEGRAVEALPSSLAAEAAPLPEPAMAVALDDEPVDLDLQHVESSPRLTSSYSGLRTKSSMPLVVVAMIVLGIGLWLGMARFAPQVQLSPDETTMSARSALEGLVLSWNVEILSDPPGAGILLDGQDLGLRTPAFIDLVGEVGAARLVELRRTGVVVARKRFELGPDTPERWLPEVSLGPVPFAIDSEPPGALLMVDGERLGVTPVEVSLVPGLSHGLRLELDGYHRASFDLTWNALSPEQRRSKRLFFPLQPTTPPGVLVLAAPYPVEVRVGGRRYGPGRAHEIALLPGIYQAELSAPGVFLQQTSRIEIGSGDRRKLQVPAAVRIKVAANPGNCRVSIDGREVDVTPFEATAVVGEHEFRFWWPLSEKSRTVSVSVTRDQQRIFGNLEP